MFPRVRVVHLITRRCRALAVLAPDAHGWANTKAQS